LHPRAEDFLHSFLQKLVAEFIGTFAVVFVAVGAVCADEYLRATGQTGFGVLGTALAYGLAVAVMTTALGHISGAHLNPAITAAFWVTKRLGSLQSLAYCVAQLLAASAAAYLLTAILPDSVWRSVGLGTPDLAPDFTRMHGMALEATVTFFVVLLAFGSSVESQGSFRNLAGPSTGLAVVIGYLIAAPFTGAAMNPARAFGPALVAHHHWQNHGVYWVGPLLGGVLAGVIYDRLLLRNSSVA
jgi:MIP family channel proteins